MIIRYTPEQFENAKSIDKLPLECEYCGTIFNRVKKEIKHELKANRGQIKYCSQKCAHAIMKLSKTVTCGTCGSQFEKKESELKKTENHFCSHSCHATYMNQHKTTGIRRSKLEIWLEEQLSILYPDLDIKYNNKDAIGSELDIYIPSLNLAFELNGIFHYEPIFGKDKLNRIQENDKSKSKACIDNQIDLCSIDTSGLKYFKPKNAQKFLDIITNILNTR